MSIDLEVWSVNRLQSVETSLPDIAWSRSAKAWSCVGSQWQITIEDSTAVDSDDVSRQVDYRRKIQYLTRLILEPSSAPESAIALLGRIADELCDQINGVVYDPQAGQLPRPRLAESVDLIEMNWWFLGEPMTTRSGALSLLEHLSAVAPEFLPKRYGEREPPCHPFEQDRVDHFLDLLFADHGLPSFVWRATNHAYIHYSPTWGPGWRWLPGIAEFGYAVPKLTIGCPGKVLLKPEGEARLKNVWRAVTALVSPMYGDVRILRGYHLRGSQIVASVNSEPHPIRGGWRGLPKHLGLAFALGRPYLMHWPEIKESGAETHFAVRSVSKWADGGEITEACGEPPDVLCAPEGGRVAPYWPFGLRPALNS
jgi:hypothetical protein